MPPPRGVARGRCPGYGARGAEHTQEVPGEHATAGLRPAARAAAARDAVAPAAGIRAAGIRAAGIRAARAVATTAAGPAEPGLAVAHPVGRAVIVLAEATVAIVFFLRGSGDPSMVSPPGALQLRGTGRLGTRLPALGSRIGQVCLADKLGSGQVAAAQVRFSGSVAVIEVCPTPGTDSALDNACTFLWQHLRIRS